MKTTALKVLFIGLSLTSLAQCGDDDALSSKVDVTFVPTTPYIVNADLTLNPGLDNEFTAEAPWFIFSSRVDNKSENQLQLVTFTFNIRGFKNGAPVSGTTSIDPNESCVVATTGGRAYLAEIPPGGFYQNLTDECDSDSITTTSSQLGYNNRIYERWYIYSLPDASSFNYDIEVIPEGWFQDDEDVPIERFTYTGYLTTQ
jgi:hypothetical protein